MDAGSADGSSRSMSDNQFMHVGVFADKKRSSFPNGHADPQAGAGGGQEIIHGDSPISNSGCPLVVTRPVRPFIH